MHVYPSEFGGVNAPDVRAAIARFPVAVVDMGHTHYNELGNDGHTIYMATRSTGQIEERPVGFSIATIDRGVVSWKFNELGHWPFVKIISPADGKLVIDPTSRDQVVRGNVEIRARVWGGGERTVVSAQIDDGYSEPMTSVEHTNLYRLAWPSTSVADGQHRVTVRAVTQNGPGSDTVVVLCSQSGTYNALKRADRDLDNALDEYP